MCHLYLGVNHSHPDSSVEILCRCATLAKAGIGAQASSKALRVLGWSRLILQMGQPSVTWNKFAVGCLCHPQLQRWRHPTQSSLAWTTGNSRHQHKESGLFREVQNPTAPFLSLRFYLQPNRLNVPQLCQFCGGLFDNRGPCKACSFKRKGEMI